MRRAALCFAGIVGLLAVHAVPAIAADPGTGAVFTNKSRFRIPFRYDPTEMQRLQAREVQLYVSTDHGLRWRMVDKADPKADHFDFLAPTDGEYWFAVRTLDAFSRLHPAGTNIEPALKVMVDATSPVLELLLTELEPGKIELRWTAADDHLDVSKLRIEYRQPDSPEWQHAAVVPQPSGQTTWEVKGGGVVAVRGSISDLAGNTVNAERDLNVHPSPHGQKKGSETEYHAPVAKASDASMADAPARETTAQNPAENSGVDTHSSTDTAKPMAASSKPTNPSHAESPESRLSSDRDFFVEDKSDKSGPNIQPKFHNDLVSDSPSKRPAIVQKPQSAESSPPTGGDDEFAEAKSTAPATPAAPKDDEPRTIVVNRCDFQIGYRIDDLGPSGLGKVELFITTDGGHKWYRYGSDPDNKSPFAVSVPADGTYGFELRVRNGAGIGDDPPHPGDKPSIVVLVDKTPPTAQLLPPQIGRGKSHNKVLLRWTAEDADFGPTPVQLEYAAEKAGPWQKIGENQPNTGRYIWSIDPGLPGKVFVRLTVTDRAGNVAQSVTPEQLVIDFTRPTAHIIDVEAKSAAPDHTPR
ncbi:MAG TPA: hypothetical protein VFG04_17885 [Planctomycetaceae bacterium]|jgi:hypothetical protein|nr:hypothetical protein [Planctomycetaceae bacterium]